MAEFVSTFTTGFKKVVEKNLPEIVSGCKILNIYDGIVHYKFNGNSHDLEKVVYFNNTFFVIKSWCNFSGNFSTMVNDFCNENKYLLISKGSFRTRFVRENQFEKIDKKLVIKVEENVLKRSKLKIDRVSPSTEIWFNIRREGFAFCGQLISKREFTEKNLNKGELRPELAYLMCCFAELKENDVIAEPFCGYGSIPIQLAKKFRFLHLYVSDIDEEKITALKEKKYFKQNDFVSIEVQDAFSLKQIKDNSVDVIISDPPWGFFEDVGDIALFYDKMFCSFKRILKNDGKMIILSARKDELEYAAEKNNYKIIERVDTLVNGKKACVYMIF